MRFKFTSIFAAGFFAIAGAVLGGSDTSNFRGLYSETIGPIAMAVIVLGGLGFALWSQYKDIEDKQNWHKWMLFLPVAVFFVALIAQSL